MDAPLALSVSRMSPTVASARKITMTLADGAVGGDPNAWYVGRLSDTNTPAPSTRKPTCAAASVATAGWRKNFQTLPVARGMYRGAGRSAWILLLSRAQ